MTQTDELKRLIPTETELCSIFMRDFNEQPGWICYPETGGFDVLVAHESGRQIGVEAKLQLNAKVADQILPSNSSMAWSRQGPDHRLVIVRSITEANAGIAKMLGQLGVSVWAPRVDTRLLKDGSWNSETYAHFHIHHEMWADGTVAQAPTSYGGREAYHSYVGLFDWNPEQRIDLPAAVPTVPAGVPAPVRMTPWKQAAVRVLARLRVQGAITAREIAAEGCSPSMWTQRWLDHGSGRGQWVESARMPKFDEQHPELYAIALENAQAANAEARAA